MNKQIAIKPHNGAKYCYSKNMVEFQKYYIKGKKPDTKEYRLYNFIYMKLQKRKL